MQPLHVILQRNGVGALQSLSRIGPPLRWGVRSAELDDRETVGSLSPTGKIADAGRSGRPRWIQQSDIVVGRMVLSDPVVELVQQILVDLECVLEDRYPGNGIVGL